MQFAAASFDGSVSIWTLQGQKWTCTATVEGHENEVKAAVWSSFIDEFEGEEKRFLATCGRDKTVWIWAVDESLHDPEDEDFECLAVLQEHEQDIKCLTWHPQVPLFLTGSYDESVRVWGPTGPSLDDWICLGALIKNAGGTIWSLAFSANGKTLAVALSTGKLVIYRLPEEEWTSFTQWTRSEYSLFHPIPLSSIQIEDGEGCSRGGGGCGDQSSHSESESESEGGCCGGGSGKKKEASGCCGGGGKQKLERKLEIPPAELYSLCWSPDSQFLAVATGKRSILIWSLASEAVGAQIDAAHDEDINCISWSPSEPSLFVSCSDDGSVKLWQFLREISE